MSFTSASSLSMGSGDALPHPRVQRVKRSDSFCAPVPPPKDVKFVSPVKESTTGIKRPPSFGTLAQEAKRDKQHSAAAANEASYPSSDEEERIRSKGAKKIKVKEPAPTEKKAKIKSKEPASPDRKAKVASPKVPKPKPPVAVTNEPPVDTLITTKGGAKRVRPGAMNLERNPSMFGPELPHLRNNVIALASPPQIPRARVPTSPVARTTSPVVQKLSVSPEIVPVTPHKTRTLRRVQRLAMGRRISFGSLASPGEDADAESDYEDGVRSERERQRELGQLGSAFQLH
jgi:transcription factor SPN1